MVISAPPPNPTSNLELIGFQAGPYGFVRVGTGSSPTGWMDYLYIIAYGGRGAGKSQGGALRVVNYIVSNPGALGVITAPTYSVMHDATFPALKRVFNQVGIIEERDYTYNATREEIRLWNGGLIFLRSTDQPQRLRGMDAAWFWMDEPRDSPLESFLNLQATLRQQGFPHQGWLTTTPLGKYHWTYPTFLPEEAEKDGLLEGTSPRGTGKYLHYFAATRDNPYGGEELYQNLIRTYGENSPRAKQELEGRITVMEGLVYPKWEAGRYVVPEDKWPMVASRVAAGVDFGFAAPSAVLVEGIDKLGRRYLMDQIYASGLDEDELGHLCAKIKYKYGISYFACDWADPRWIRTLRRKFHLPAVRARKRMGRTSDPSSGIGLCTKALADDEDGNQMFFVSPKCRDFIAEIENYVNEDPQNLKNPSEKPRKFRDHLMDAWRYAEEFIADRWHKPGQRITATIPTRSGMIKERVDVTSIIQELKEVDGS